MKTAIEVKSKTEGESLKAGLARPDVRAFAIVCGVLDGLPSDRSRARVLAFVADYLDERDDAAAVVTKGNGAEVVS